MSSVRDIYNEFVKHVSTKEFVKLLPLIQSMKVDQQPQLPKYQFMVRTSLIAVKHQIPNADVHIIAVAFKSYADMMNLSAKCQKFDDYMENLCMISRKSDLEQSIDLLTDAKTAVPVRQWLRSLTNSLQVAVERDKLTRDDTQLKTTFIHLTAILLIYLRVECAHPNLTANENGSSSISETVRFLDICMAMPCFTDQQYKKCFGLLKSYLLGLQSSSEFLRTCSLLEKECNALINNKNIRATLIMDTSVTLSRFLLISKPVFAPHLSVANMDGLFDLMWSLIPLLRSTVYLKTFCSWCQNADNIGLHCIIDIAVQAYEIIMDAIAKDLCSKGLAANFGRIMAKMIGAATWLTCPMVENYQRNTLQRVRTFISNFKTKEHVQFVLPVLNALAASVHKHDLSKANSSTPYNALHLLRHLFEAHEMAGNVLEMIRVGHLYIPFAIASGTENTNLFHNIIYKVAIAQRTDDMKDEFITPYDFLSDEKSNFYGLPMPKNIDHAHILFTYLRVIHTYLVFSKEFNNKIIHQILMNASESCPSRYLSFVLYTSNFCYKPIEEQIRQVLQGLTKTNTTEKMNCVKVALIKGAFKFVDYLNTTHVIDEKFRKISFKDEIENPTSEIMNELTFNLELEQTRLLIYVKEKFHEFVNFYLNLAKKEREDYNDEYKYLLVEALRLARQFTIRLYPEHAMQMYILLFRLSLNDVSNEVSEIIAVSYFVEYSGDYQRFNVGENQLPDLETILDGAYPRVVRQLESIQQLSHRKQNELYNCLLNLALHYVGTGRPRHAQLLLRFIERRNRSCTDTYDFIRLKYDLTILKMVERFKVPHECSVFDLGQKIFANSTKSYHIIAEDTISVAMAMIDVINVMTNHSYHRFKHVADMEKLSALMVKYAMSLGMLLRATSLMNIGLLLVVAREKKEWQDKFKMLDHIYFTDGSKKSSTSHTCVKELAREAPKPNQLHVPPIRKVGKMLSPVKTVPFQIIGDIELQCNRYLVNHVSKCKCGICLNAPVKAQVLRTGFIHVYLQLLQNEQRSNHIESEFSAMYDQWKRCKSADESDALFTVHLFIWKAHMQFLAGKGRGNVIKYLKRAQEELLKVPNYDVGLEIDILTRINYLNQENVSQTLPSMEHLLSSNVESKLENKEEVRVKTETGHSMSANNITKGAIKKEVKCEAMKNERLSRVKTREYPDAKPLKPSNRRKDSSSKSITTPKSAEPVESVSKYHQDILLDEIKPRTTISTRTRSKRIT